MYMYRDHHRKPKGFLKSKHIFRTSPKSKHTLSPKSKQKMPCFARFEDENLRKIVHKH